MNSQPATEMTRENHEVDGGLDVAKATFDAALWLPLAPGAVREQHEMPAAAFPRTRQGVRQFLAWMDAILARHVTVPLTAIRMVMEATGRYSVELAVWLMVERPTLHVAIINPQVAAHYRRSLSFRNNTDRIAARALARYGAERRPAPYEPLTPERAELRELSRYRQTLVETRVAETNRAAETTASSWVARSQQKHLRYLEREIARIEQAMRAIVERIPELKRDAELIDGIFGVGFITTVAILAELGDLRRFEHGRQLTAFVGMAPRHFQSGTSVHRKTRLSKCGEPRLRALLYMCATTAITGDNDLAHFYHRLLARGKTKMAALGAVMRKLLLLMRALVISGQPYQPHYHRPGKPVHNSTKMEAIST
ncbi:MAG: transposase [Candidatus Sumerlaeota bacterium]|nr:transposase [Candidatus Sumerlaeota bacterium]